MVYGVFTGGRIGNMLFQTAAAVSLSKDATMCLNNPDQKKYIKKYKDNILRKVKIIETTAPCTNFYYQPSLRFEQIPYKEDEDIAIVGGFQSEKYFNEDVVRDIFEIDDKTKNFIDEKYGHLFKNEITSICVRRGDYLKLPHQFTFCGKKYYKDAIQFIGKNKQYLINSDDIAWCKKVFKGSNFHFVENSTPIVDLYLQSFCTNNIISNSTFCWWGAWLNANPDKIVVAPKRWFGIYLKLDTSDLIPSSYLFIDNRNFFTRYIYGSYKYYEEKMMIKLQNTALRPYLRRIRKLLVKS
jgi:hypothetical protein